MPPPTDALIAANLLRIAHQDLAGARQLAAIGNRNAPYLRQQAAEKIARMVAHPEGGHPGREFRHRNRCRFSARRKPAETAAAAVGTSDALRHDFPLSLKDFQ